MRCSKHRAYGHVYYYSLECPICELKRKTGMKRVPNKNKLQLMIQKELAVRSLLGVPDNVTPSKYFKEVS